MPLDYDVSYTCPSCGEANFIGADPSGGRRQRLTEDCPVCCRPIEFVLAFDSDGDAMVVSCELAQ